MAQDKEKPKQQGAGEWLRKPSGEQEVPTRLSIVAESKMTPELRKALDDVARELAKKPGIVEHKECQKVTIRCPKVTIEDGCVILVTCSGYGI